MAPVLTVTGRLARSRHGRAIVEVVEEVAPFFPELEGQRIRIDVIRPGSRFHGLAFAAEHPPRIALNGARARDPEFGATVAHELTHLLQWPGRTVPGGERACDLYTLARVGTRFVGPPGYLRIPTDARRDWPRWAGLAHRLAQEALRERARGRRTYIVWWEREFRRAVVPAGARPPR